MEQKWRLKSTEGHSFSFSTPSIWRNILYIVLKTKGFLTATIWEHQLLHLTHQRGRFAHINDVNSHKPDNSSVSTCVHLILCIFINIAFNFGVFPWSFYIENTVTINSQTTLFTEYSQRPWERGQSLTAVFRGLTQNSNVWYGSTKHGFGVV